MEMSNFTKQSINEKSCYHKVFFYINPSLLDKYRFTFSLPLNITVPNIMLILVS